LVPESDTIIKNADKAVRTVIILMDFKVIQDLPEAIFSFVSSLDE
jgi:hypothetical protein